MIEVVREASILRSMCNNPDLWVKILVDMSFLKVGDTITLNNVLIRQLPTGEHYCLFATKDGHEINPFKLLRRGNGINFDTNNLEEAAGKLYDEVMGEGGLTLTVAKIYKSESQSGSVRLNYRFNPYSMGDGDRYRREEEERRRKEEEEKRMLKYGFNIRNKHRRDDKINFCEQDHTYTVDGVPLDSVTSFVSNCFPKFNADYYSQQKAEKLGISQQEVLDKWEKNNKESRDLGTAMHRKIENYFLGYESPLDDSFKLFKIFAEKFPLKPYRTEWAVYDWSYKIAGTIDFVDYQNGEFIIYDWKRSNKIISGNGLPIKKNIYGEKALPPIENIDDSPYYHYALQLSLYKYILENNYSIKVNKLRLGIFHPSYIKPYIIEMPYLEDELKTLFTLKSEIIF